MSNREGGLGDLLVQAKITNRLLAAGLRAQMKQQELVSLLATTDATAREIAEILDTTPATVTTTLARLRKKSNKSSESNE